MENEITDERPPDRHHLLSNIVAGICVAYTCFPIEGLKKWWQSMKNDKTLTSWKEYKILRGSIIFGFNIIPTTVIQLSTYHFLKQSVPDQTAFKNKLIIAAVSGMSGAICSTFVENTIMRSKVLKSNPAYALKDMFKVSLFRPWKSYGCIATRDCIFTTCMFCILPEVEKYCQNNYQGNFWVDFCARFTVGFIGTTLSHPWDTFATRMQITHEKISIREAYSDALKNLTYSNVKRPIMCLYTGFIYRLALFNIFQTAIPYVRDKTQSYLNKYEFA